MIPGYTSPSDSFPGTPHHKGCPLVKQLPDIYPLLPQWVRLENCSLLIIRRDLGRHAGHRESLLETCSPGKLGGVPVFNFCKTETPQPLVTWWLNSKSSVVYKSASIHLLPFCCEAPSGNHPKRRKAQRWFPASVASGVCSRLPTLGR